MQSFSQLDALHSHRLSRMTAACAMIHGQRNRNQGWQAFHVGHDNTMEAVLLRRNRSNLAKAADNERRPTTITSESRTILLTSEEWAVSTNPHRPAALVHSEQQP